MSRQTKQLMNLEPLKDQSLFNTLYVTEIISNKFQIKTKNVSTNVVPYTRLKYIPHHTTTMVG